MKKVKFNFLDVLAVILYVATFVGCPLAIIASM